MLWNSYSGMLLSVEHSRLCVNILCMLYLFLHAFSPPSLKQQLREAFIYFVTRDMKPIMRNAAKQLTKVFERQVKGGQLRLCLLCFRGRLSID